MQGNSLIDLKLSETVIWCRRYKKARGSRLVEKIQNLISNTVDLIAVLFYRIFVGVDRYEPF